MDCLQSSTVVVEDSGTCTQIRRKTVENDGFILDAIDMASSPGRHSEKGGRHNIISRERESFFFYRQSHKGQHVAHPRRSLSFHRELRTRPGGSANLGYRFVRVERESITGLKHTRTARKVQKKERKAERESHNSQAGCSAAARFLLTRMTRRTRSTSRGSM